MKKIICMLAAVIFIVSSLSIPSEASPSPVKTTYTVSVYTSDIDDAGTDSNITYNFDIDTESIKIKNPKTQNDDCYEQGNIDTFSFTCDSFGCVISSFSVTSDLSGNKSGWHIQKIVIATEFTTPKGKKILDVVNCGLNKWIEKGNDSIRVVPALYGGLLFYDNISDIEINGRTQKVQSEGLYRIKNCDAVLADSWTSPIFELVYDVTQKSQSIFSVPLYIFHSVLSARGQVESVSSYFASPYLNFLAFVNDSVKVAQDVIGKYVTTLYVSNTSSHPLAYSSEYVDTLIISLSDVPVANVAASLPNLKYVINNDSGLAGGDKVLKSFPDNVKILFWENNLAEAKANLPSIAGRMDKITGDYYKYEASVISSGSPSVAFIVAIAEGMVIVGLAVYIIADKTKKRGEKANIAK